MSGKKNTYQRMKAHKGPQQIPDDTPVNPESLTGFERDLYLAVVRTSIEVLHRHQPLGAARNQATYFSSVIKDSHYLAKLHVEMFREMQKEAADQSDDATDDDE